MSRARTVRWRPAGGEGLEHLELDESSDGIIARSVLIGTAEDVRFGARYEVRLAPDWTFRQLRLERMDGAVLALERDPAGGWQLNGAPAPHFSGCIDIDISATPFTNTLPVRRARFEPGVPQLFHMVWIPLDTLDPFVDGQVYTERDRTHFRYQAADLSFAADLTLDDAGLVLDYPGLFRRA